MVASRVFRICNKIISSHRASYGKLGDPKTWIISLVASAVFLLIFSLLMS